MIVILVFVKTLNRQIQQLDSALACEREESSKQATILRERYETALNEVIISLISTYKGRKGCISY